MAVLVKICGLTDRESLRAAVEAGADMIGLTFYPPSPRAVTPEQAAVLARDVTFSGDVAGGPVGGPVRVALAVDPDDALIDAIVGTGVIDMIQLHGRETPERVAAIRTRTGLPVMKALRVADAEDVAGAAAYDGVADRILFDAKAPKGMTGALPGGNGLSFDWHLLDGLSIETPWMLAGGLNPENVAEAIRLTGAPGVDTVSGVEDRPGVKNLAKIRAFIEAARGA